MLKKCIAAVLFLLFTSSICHKSPVEPQPANVVAEKFEGFFIMLGKDPILLNPYKIILYNEGEQTANNIILKIKWTLNNIPQIDTLFVSLADLYIPIYDQFEYNNNFQKYGRVSLATTERTQELWFIKSIDENDPQRIGMANLLNVLWNK